MIDKVVLSAHDFEKIKVLVRSLELRIDQLNISLNNLFNETVHQHRKIKSPKIFMTRKEVKQFLKISYSILDNYTQKGLLQSYNFGDKVFYKSQEVKSQFLNLNRNE